ncbi:hypothetical protein [Marinomonas mediterranea]|uniref:hypothetical protein n=1 Tax=Marinomonas mediterranea TaxID=119864 RepID=UPI00234A08C2|nr:hypothetical protein [Marinomonas mediterranea]WCN08306.1 hypothetical protein GV055_04930 [Marinomonas mediterranea]
MLFIDPITKTHLKIGQQNEPLKRRTTYSKLISDEVDISTEAHSVKEIALFTDQTHELQPEDSLIANLLAAVFDKCEKKHTPTIPLQSINKQTKRAVILQTPPIPRALSHNNAGDVNESKHKIEEFTAHVPVISKEGRSVDFTLFLELGLGSPKIADLFKESKKKIDTQPVKTPYELSYITSLPKELTFIVDQDGEADQIQTLLDIKQGDAGDIGKAGKYENAEGLRVWLINPKLITPILLGDANLGYVYVGNVTPSHKHIQSEEHPVAYQGIDIEA